VTDAVGLSSRTASPIDDIVDAHVHIGDPIGSRHIRQRRAGVFETTADAGPTLRVR